MVVAFVFTDADPESLEDVLKALKAVDGVRQAYCYVLFTTLLLRWRIWGGLGT